MLKSTGKPSDREFKKAIFSRNAKHTKDPKDTLEEDLDYHGEHSADTPTAEVKQFVNILALTLKRALHFRTSMRKLM